MNMTELHSRARVFRSCSNLRLIVAGIALLIFGVCGARSQGVVYVCRDAAGANDGTSWTDAYTNLAAALDATGAGTNIWVAEGTYHPGADRSDSFCLKTNVSVYGGFTTQMVEFSQRDWTGHVTVLSGDIQQDGDPANNSYHVLISISVTNSALDGFTVTGGNADGAHPYNNGGGMINRDYTFSTIANCLFISNFATNWGGAMYNTNRGSPTIVNCAFRDNTATGYGGAICNINYSRPAISNCMFVDNRAVQGGGIYSKYQCLFPVKNCKFIGNGYVHKGSGGAMYQYDYCSPFIDDCLFTRNAVNGKGGAIDNDSYCYPRMKNCLLCGNETTNGWDGDGAALNSGRRSDPLITNCLFVGNAAYRMGGAICVYEGNIYWKMVNSVIAGNRAGSGGALSTRFGNPGQVALTNCILWGNEITTGSGSAIYNSMTNTIFMGYCDVEGGWDGPGVVNADASIVTDGGGNINADPVFVAPIVGEWTADGVYDWNSVQTVLTDANASWTPGEHAGKTIKPNTNVLHFAIFTNTATTITVWADASMFGTNEAVYSIHDWHLMSRGGRWTGSGWTRDTRHSPCIDAGDPNWPYANEPEPNGGRVNIGAYGNTPEASKKLPNGSIVQCR